VKRASVDLIVGGSILISLIILIAGVLWLKEISITSKMVSYAAVFPNVGSLSVGDPVLVNGVKMGTVGDIFLRGTKVAVVIKLDRSVLITDSAAITVQNIGLMGERTVGITPSEKGAPLRHYRKGDQQYPFINGHFDTGIAEAMGMIGTVLGDVQVLVRNVQGIVDSTLGDTSFITFYRHVVARLDTVTLLADQLVKQNKGKLDRSLSDVSVITADIKRILKDNETNVDQLLANGNELSARGVKIAVAVESLTVQLNTMVGSIERGEGSIGQLMKDDKFYTDLKGTVKKLDNLVNDVQDRGLKLRIKVGFKEAKKSP
jgi:phospholipid/cholesterol/gamma-HCH transport system substrate-binding protein